MAKATERQHEIRQKTDEIKYLGKGARADYERLCKERNLEDELFSFEFTEAHMEVCELVWAMWHTTEKFKVGDKVYVVPLQPTIMPTCIRATVTEVGTDRWGYHLRAFESDLPGIYMFNMWDKDLEPRVGKKVKPTPKELFINTEDD